MGQLYAEKGREMRERFISYFKDNSRWVIAFILLVISDGVLTLYILSSQYGMEPFVSDCSFDWSYNFWRIDTVILLIPILSIMKWRFARNWILQGITVGYGWTVLNGISIALFKFDIGIYQFLPLWAYYFGILFQFIVGIGLLWIYRYVRRTVDVH